MTDATLTADEQMGAYTEAVQSGLYNKKTGLTGKYDNVRRYWEDEITGMMLRDPLEKLVQRNRERMLRLRVLDLGCGSADGYELLTGVRCRDADLQQREVDLLNGEVLGEYTGSDLNEDLLDQARAIYGNNPKMRFIQGDFTQGLPVHDDGSAYDLYFTSFGTFSHHNDDETAIALLADIAKRTEHYATVVCDWLGRYSYEWQSLWTNEPETLRNMDYVVSYIYEPEERQRRRAELQHLNLRLMSRPEAHHIIDEASGRAGVEIKPLMFFDRSVMTGRHLDTREYNRFAQPMRAAVNALHEINVRTDLEDLLFDYAPKRGFDFLNDYFENVQMCWNTLIRYVMQLLEQYDPQQRRFKGALPDIPGSYPESLREMMGRMRVLCEGVGWLSYGLPRENIIEPQLGYALRNLILERQQGQGAAHGLVCVLEIDKQK
ncbi:MAG: methyltransferase domain-containing protein [Planctomycetes bacterium]|jgi:SAM-dependent methyltransferase|nr:class I SAM-dependent methyltransferase [Phycisphaerae bacterium]NBB95955.1 methyltransferase domain-containing protein [Planctomycetota bacterium]